MGHVSLVGIVQCVHCASQSDGSRGDVNASDVDATSLPASVAARYPQPIIVAPSLAASRDRPVAPEQHKQPASQLSPTNTPTTTLLGEENTRSPNSPASYRQTSVRPVQAPPAESPSACELRLSARSVRAPPRSTALSFLPTRAATATTETTLQTPAITKHLKHPNTNPNRPPSHANTSNILASS